MVTVGIATMPGRENNLRVVIDSLWHQADRIIVYSNDPNGPPSWLEDYDRVLSTGPVAGDLTDAGKLYGLPMTSDGYYLVCDDDMVYPVDYVKHIVQGIERYERKRVVGFAGGRLKDPPITSYCVDGRTENIRWDADNQEDWPCNLLLTCLAGWHISLLPGFDHTVCTVGKMVDIWLALAAQRAGVGMTVLARPAGWIGYQGVKTQTIWRELARPGADRDQTTVINAFAKPFKLL